MNSNPDIRWKQRFQNFNRAFMLLRDAMEKGPSALNQLEKRALFGSRAKGTHTERSDVDLAVAGDVAPLRAEAIAAELDELPLPYRFEVQPLEHIHYRPLLEHIKRVGIVIYPATCPQR